jgi:hypothetical protein
MTNPEVSGSVFVAGGVSSLGAEACDLNEAWGLQAGGQPDVLGQLTRLAAGRTIRGTCFRSRQP